MTKAGVRYEVNQAAAYEALSDMALQKLIHKLEASQKQHQHLLEARNELVRRAARRFEVNEIAKQLVRTESAPKWRSIAEDWAPALGLSAEGFLRMARAKNG